MNIKSIVCCFSLLSCTYLFGGDIYQIMQQEAPQPSTTKKPTQIPIKRRIRKPGTQAPVIEKEQPAMTSSQGMEYLQTALQKEKAQQKQYYELKRQAADRKHKQHQQKIEREFNNVGLTTLNSQNDYDTYKKNTKKLLPRLIKYADRTQTQYNDPIIKAFQWHDPAFVYELLELPEYKFYTDFNFKSNAPQGGQKNLSGQEFLDKLKSATFASQHGYQDPREIKQMMFYVNYMLTDPDLGSRVIN